MRATGRGRQGLRRARLRRRLRAAACAAVLLAVGAAVATPEAPVTVGAQVEPSEVTVGQLLTLTVAVTAERGVTLTLPGEGADFGEAEVRGLTKQEEVAPDGKRVVTLKYQLALFEVGEAEITAPPVTYQAEGEAAREAARPKVAVTVKSVLPEGADDIKDIRAPKQLPLSVWQWLGLIAALLLLAGVVVGALVLWRRLRRKEQQEEVAPPLPPHLEALAALAELEADDPVSRGDLKEHYVRLSWIIRRYLWRRYRLPALEETTRMIALSLRASGRAPREAEGFLPVLREADLAKFAKHRPADQVARRALEVTRQLVEATRPVETPVAEPEEVVGVS